MIEYKGMYFPESTSTNIKETIVYAYATGHRVVVTYKEGYEDYGGYKIKNNPLVHTMYIGASTGTCKVPLEILRIGSKCGAALLVDAIKSIQIRR